MEYPEVSKNLQGVGGQTPSQAKEEVVVDISLVSNARAAGGAKGFVARVKQNGELEFLRASVPRFHLGMLTGGKFLVYKGDVLVVKSIESSHKHARSSYTLYVVEDELKYVAEIAFEDGSPTFNPEELEDIYISVKARGGDVKSFAIAALIEYAKAKQIL